MATWLLLTFFICLHNQPKIWVGLCLSIGKHVFLEVSFKKSIGSSKNGTRDFQNSPPFQRSACFDATIGGNFERFQCFNFEIDFRKTGAVFFS